MPHLTTWLVTIVLLGAAAIGNTPGDAPGAILSPPPLTVVDRGESTPPQADIAAQDAWQAMEWVRLDQEAAELTAEQARRDAQVASWQGVALCEMAGRWDYVGPIYSGIGFHNGTWVAYGGLEFAPNAGMASPYDQTVIAIRVRDHVGRSAWSGCARYVP